MWRGSGPGYGPGVDLRAWLLDAHAGLHQRLRSGVVDRVPLERWTELAHDGGSSIGWLVLHLARHQDLALTTAIRNHAPLFLAHRESLGLGRHAPWSGLTEREDPVVTAAAVGSSNLLVFVDAVFDATHAWLRRLSAMAMESVPDTSRRLEQHALLPREELEWLHAMWDGRTVAWFVEWPILGHGNTHIGEAVSVRNRLGLSPF